MVFPLKLKKHRRREDEKSKLDEERKVRRCRNSLVLERNGLHGESSRREEVGGADELRVRILLVVVAFRAIDVHRPFLRDASEVGFVWSWEDGLGESGVCDQGLG